MVDIQEWDIAVAIEVIALTKGVDLVELDNLFPRELQRRRCLDSSWYPVVDDL